MAHQENIIEIRNVAKQFPGVRALNDVSLDIKRNAVHCIVGENGAGKSTLIKILTGAYEKSSGEITLKGKPFSPLKVRDAMSCGISVLYQELNVVDELTVEGNLTLGQEKHKFWFPTKADDLNKAEEILKSFDESIKLKTLVGHLSVAQKQVIEITKALCADCSVLIMDEPTAALSLAETGKLFNTVQQLKKTGVTIIYITHKLSEIFEIGEFVSVFKDGEMVGTKPVAGMTGTDLVKMMLGKVVAESYIPSKGDRSEKILEVKNVRTAKLKNISFELFKGEILGFYGLVGAGKTEVSEILYGGEYDGEVRINGKIANFKSVRDAVKSGLALVPEERREEGIFGLLGIRENIPLMNLKNIIKNGLVNRIKENQLADRYIKMFSIAARDRNHQLALLSGGNQQKVVISKCLNRESDILLMDEPTRGVDVGAKVEIHNIIRELANQGKSIIVFSSELQEIVNLCDRIVLMYDGSVRKTLDNGDDISMDHIMEVVAGKGV
ncbi:MAG: sugar ABC transporter ATP-binding protein [Deltaproteobacteria bacterium]|jgi:ribose transport system ATP-binding protein|nr:sugar ABC transporter ATP-binding protein [Deltaproteobacteria bacterium]